MSRPPSPRSAPTAPPPIATSSADRPPPPGPSAPTPHTSSSPSRPSYELPYLRQPSLDDDSTIRPSGPFSAPPSSSPSSQLPQTRPTPLPARASTLGSPSLPSPTYLTSDTYSPSHSRPPTRAATSPQLTPSASSDGGHAPPNPPWLNTSSTGSAGSNSSHAGTPTTPNREFPPSSEENMALNSRSPNPTSTVSGHSSSSVGSQFCAACGLPMTGQFVRALGTVYHLDCFRCKDCNDVVASKFFPIEGPDGKQHPLCERDYFGRLNLICAKCDQALRGSYITACNKKYHVEHFTCSVCTTLFGPQDSYYEHDNNVYCHFHYSTRFATKCVGCNSAILKQFVEINRNSRDECWHPECYMIHKFWHIKVVSKPSTADDPIPPGGHHYDAEEQTETATSLAEKQQKMESLTYRIWTHLSAFEESSAACISDMLRHVSNGQYLEAIRMAERFILHVEVLFAAIDDLESHFTQVRSKGMSHVREARMLCRKTVDLFTLLSHTGDAGSSRRMGMTQELLSLVTGLAHYLKILIRIALTGALKLDRDHARRIALDGFLDKLQSLAIEGANPSNRRVVNSSKPREVTPGQPNQAAAPSSSSSTSNVLYGYKSLAPDSAGESPFVYRSPNAANGSTPATTMMNPPSDLCLVCDKSVDEDCVRLGTYLRWHSHCIKCQMCGKTALDPSVNREPPMAKSVGLGDESSEVKTISTARRPPARVEWFLYTLDGPSSSTKDPYGQVPSAICCTDHPLPGARPGFAAVTRLEQYAYLLNVALRRLYLLLLRRGLIPPAPPSSSSASYNSSSSTLVHSSHQNGHASSSSSAHGGPPNSYRASQDDIMRMKSVHLDRKLSATARLPKRSTIVESPSGKFAQPRDVASHSSASGGLRNSPSSGNLRDREREKKIQPPSQPPSQPTSSSSPSTRAPPSALPPPNQPVDASLTSPKTILRPAFARNNTTIQIIDESPREDDDEDGRRPSGAASSMVAHAHFSGGPSGRENEFIREEDEGDESGREDEDDSEGLTLGDIPQLLESEQAREQRRSLPRQKGAKPAIAELGTLELMIVKHFAALMLQKSAVLKDGFELDEILELLETKKSGFWGKIFKGNNDKKNIKKKGVFGVPLELLVERDGADSLLGASRATLRIPSFIDDIISAMKQMDMSVEGIFRKNGNIRRLKELTEAIDRDPTLVDLTTDNPVQLAALLKKFLRALPDPLLTFKLHRLFILSQSFPTESDRLRYLHLVSLLLPKSHRDTMEALFVFIKWVASFSHIDAETGSKMDLGNLATVLCPSILYSKGDNVVRDESFMAIQVVTVMLSHQDELFTVPDEFLLMLQDQEYFTNCLELPSKEVLKKCEAYLRVKQGRPLASAAPSFAGNSPAMNGNGNGNGNGTNTPRGEDGRGRDNRPVHQQKSDPTMRGRPVPPFAAEGASSPSGTGKRSPRSASRGPPPSSSSHGHYNDSMPSSWTPGSPLGNNKGGGRAPFPVSYQNNASSTPPPRPFGRPALSDTTHGSPVTMSTTAAWDIPQRSHSRPSSMYGNGADPFGRNPSHGSPTPQNGLDQYRSQSP